MKANKRFTPRTAVMWAWGAAGVAVLGAAWFLPAARAQFHAAPLPPVLIVLATATVAGSFSLRLSPAVHTALSLPVSAAAAPLFGPFVAAWVAAASNALATVIDEVRERWRPTVKVPTDVRFGRLPFNVAVGGLQMLVGGLLYVAAGGDVPLRELTPASVLAVAALYVGLELPCIAMIFTTALATPNENLGRTAKTLVLGSLYEAVMLPLTFVYAVVAARAGTATTAVLSAVIVAAAYLLHERSRMSYTLKRYVAPEKAREIMKASGDFFTTSRREMTVLFCDLRGHTAATRGLAAEELFALLNDFHREMVRLAFRHGGTVDKIMGDGLMLLFGAPLPDVDHARHAVATAVAMQEAHRNLQERWRGAGLPAPGLGVGVATGNIVVGNLGTEERLDYTAVGREVNDAAKLCAAAAAGEVLVSEVTARALGGAWATETVATPAGRAFRVVRGEP